MTLPEGEGRRTLADYMVEVLTDRGVLVDEDYHDAVAEVEVMIEEDWPTVFGPWLDSVEDRLALLKPA